MEKISKYLPDDDLVDIETCRGKISDRCSFPIDCAVCHFAARTVECLQWDCLVCGCAGWQALGNETKRNPNMEPPSVCLSVCLIFMKFALLELRVRFVKLLSDGCALLKLTQAVYLQATRNSHREWRYHMLLVYNYVLLKMSTWGSKHVEENNILWINNNQCIKLVINI